MPFHPIKVVQMVPRWIWLSLFIFGVTRLGLLFVAYVGSSLVIDPSDPPRVYLRPNNVLLDGFGGRWDTPFYLEIAQKGYTYREAALPSVAFFPLLPILIRLFTLLTGDPIIAGLFVTNTALMGATLFFYRLVHDEWGIAVAGRAIWYFLIFPTSFFGSAIYSDSLFLLGAIGALYYARKGHWWFAAGFGIVATLSRLIGIVVVPMLLAEWWIQYRRAQQPRPALVTLLAPVLVPLGTATYMFYLQRTFGDPIAFANGSAAWGRMPRVPWAMLAEIVKQPAEGWESAILASRIAIDGWIDVLFLITFIVIASVLLYQRRWSEGVLVAIGILIPLSSGLLASQRRYMWVLFPAFTLLARWGDRLWVDRLITVFSLLALGLFTVLFVNWYWVA